MKRALVAAVAVAGAGCSLLYDTGKLGPSADDGGVDEGGPSDGAPDAEAGALRFCSVVRPPPNFCADFEGPNLKEEWDNASVNPDPSFNAGGLFQADDPPPPELEGGSHSVALSIPEAKTGVRGGTAFLLKTFDPAAPIVELNVLVKLESTTTPGSNSVGWVSMDFGLSGAAGSVVVVRNGAGDSLAVFQGQALFGPKVQLKQPLPANEWFQLHFKVDTRPDADGGGGTATVDVNGSLIASAPVPPSFQNETADVSIGPVGGNGPLSEFKVAFDNAFVYLLP